MQSPEWVEIYAPNGTIAKPGQIIKRPALAKTLNTIALKGAGAFYKVLQFYYYYYTTY